MIDLAEESIGGRRGRASTKVWTVTLRLPEEWEAIFMKLIASPDNPYETITDIVRHGFSTIMDMWEDELQSSKLAAAFASERMIRDFIDEESTYQQLKDNMESMKALHSKLLADGQDDRAAEIIEKFKEVVEALPDEYWRDRYRKELGKWQG
jgi:hypothetical protein